MRLTVAKIGRAQGLRGEVTLDVRTDEPDLRFVPGARFETVPASAGPLTVESAREHRGRWYVAFAEILDRTAAEESRGIELVLDVESSDEEDAWYPHELAGLRVERTDGTPVGEVLGVEHMPAHDLLVIRETSGARTLVPFVTAIVPVVDVAGGRVVVDPPGGLLADDVANLEVVPPTPGSGDDTEEQDGGPR